MSVLLPGQRPVAAGRPQEPALSRLRLSRPRTGATTLALAAGLTGYLAHPPLAWWPVVFLPVPLLLAAIAVEVDGARRAERRPRVLALGAICGAASYGPMLTWLVHPAGVLGWVALVAVESLFVGLFAVTVRPWITRAAIALVAPLAWTGMEAWRSTFPLNGFGWGELAYAHTAGSWLLPVARIAGGHGLTLVTAAAGAFAFDATRRVAQQTAGLDGPLGDRVRGGLPHAQPALLGLVGVLLVGTLATIEPPAPSGETVDVLAVQPNDDPRPTGRALEVDRRIAATALRLTEQAVQDQGQPDLTVWPESTIDRDPTTAWGADLRPAIVAGARAVGGNLLVGANLDGPRPRTFANTALLLDADAQVRDRYQKRRLVPFGEYVPLRSVLGEFGPLRQVPLDAVPGEGPQTVGAQRFRVAVAICFETLFGDLVRSNVLDGDAGVIVASTNDASFGATAEPAQHLAQSRLRAIETGRWVVHAALSGSSAFVDPDGGVHQATPLFTATAVRRDIPLVTGRTPYLATGDVVGTVSRAAALALLLYVFVWRRQHRRPRTPEGSS